MSASFAGSRSLDERRRRRLASEPDDVNLSAADEASPSPIVSKQPTTRPAPNPAVSHFPLRKLVSARFWKLWGIGLVVFALGGGIAAAGFYNAQYSDTLGPGFVRLFNLETGRAVDCYVSLLLVISAQLALLIWWVRSQSSEDYAGQYHMWTWIAGAGFLMAILSAADGHWAFSEAVLWFWKVDFWNDRVLCWMIPLSAVSAVFFAAMHGDMRGCRSSLAMLWLGALGWLAAAVLTLRDALLNSLGVLDAALLAGAAMFGACCVFLSLLLHARYVIYHTADPPKARTSRFKLRLPRIGLPKLRLPKRQHRAAETATEGESNAAATKTRRQKKSGRDAAKAKRRAAEKSLNQAAHSSGDSASKPTAANERQKPSPSRKAGTEELIAGLDGETNMRLDEPPDKDQLKGLSKRERRKLRKQWRDQQRAARAQR